MYSTLVYLCIFSAFMLPAQLLTWLGIPGSGSGDNFFERIHIASYCIFFSYLVALFLNVKTAHKHSVIVYYMNVAAGLWWMFYGFFVNEQAATIPFVSYLCPFIFAIMLSKISADQRIKITTFVHSYILINAVIAIGEYVFQTKLIPIGMDEYVGDARRSSALFGHSLTAACLTGAYVLSVLSNIKSYKSLLWPIISIGLSLLAMAVYGGRTAAISMAFFSIIIIARGEWMYSSKGRINSRRIAGFVTAMFLLAGLVGIGFSAGLFDVFIERALEDKGSGYTRVVALKAVASSSFEQILVGRTDKYITYWDANFNRVGFTTPESFWLNILYYNGLVVFLPVAVSFLMAGRQFYRQLGEHSVYPLLHFLVCISGSTGLGGKNQLLVMIIVLATALCHSDQKNNPVKGASNLRHKNLLRAN